MLRFYTHPLRAAITLNACLLTLSFFASDLASLAYADLYTIEKDGVIATDEGCLSVPGFYEEVERAEQIKVRFLNQGGVEVELQAEGLQAVCIQHEIDHLDGKLFVDYISESKRQRIRKKLLKERRHLTADAV